MDKVYIQGLRKFIAEADNSCLEKVIRIMASHSCPSDFGMIDANPCENLKCKECWINALGGKADD